MHPDRSIPVLYKSKSRRWTGLVLFLVLLIWIGIDLFVPTRNTIRQFNPQEVARLETAMWRSYYDKEPVGLFWELAGGLRQQFHAPFWRSFSLAFQATRAAFTFKQGQSLTDYQQALPQLITYYQAIQDLTVERFDVPAVAQLELDWWVVHRLRKRYSYDILAERLSETAAALYKQPTGEFAHYGRLRAEAMRLCDEAGRQPAGASSTDWQRIERALQQAWGNLHEVVQPQSKAVNHMVTAGLHSHSLATSSPLLKSLCSNSTISLVKPSAGCFAKSGSVT